MTAITKYVVSEISEVYCGGTPKTSDKNNYNGNIAWITPKDLSGFSHKCIDFGARNITERGRKDAGLKILPRGTVLLSTRAPIGYVAIASNELCINQGFKAFVCDQEKVLNEYLYYYFKRHRQKLESIANGTTFKEVSLSSIKSLVIEVPSMIRQKDIVYSLDCLEQKIEINSKIIKQLEQYVTCLYKKHYYEKSYEFKPIGDVVQLISGGTPSTSNSEYWDNGDVLWYSPTDITKTSDIFLTESSKKISDKGLSNSAAKIVPAFSVLLTSRATVGRVAITAHSASTNQGIITLAPNDKYTYYDLYFWIKENTEGILALSNGSTFKEIFKRDLKKMPIAILSDHDERFHNEIDKCFLEILALINENKKLHSLINHLIQTEIL